MFRTITRMIAIPAIALALCFGGDTKTAEAGGFSLSVGGYGGRGLNIYSGPGYRSGLYGSNLYRSSLYGVPGGRYGVGYRGGPSIYGSNLYRSYRPSSFDRYRNIDRGYYRSYRDPRYCR